MQEWGARKRNLREVTHAVMALDMPWQIRGCCGLQEFHEELATNWEKPKQKQKL